MKKLTILSITLAGLLTLTACGGSSSSSSDEDFVGGAEVKITSQPKKINTGDRTRVSIEISKVHENGILLKVLYPKGLRYATSTGNLIADNDERRATPNVEVETDDGIFVVFFLKQNDFVERAGILEFELIGDSPVRVDRIEVDADVNDPLIDDLEEFDPENPLFTAESETSIEVIQ